MKCALQILNILLVLSILLTTSETAFGNTPSGSIGLPVISGITPTTLCANDFPQTVTIQGEGFVAGVQIMVDFPAGGTAIWQGDRISNITPTSFNASVELPVNGTFTFRARNVDGGISQPFAVIVQNCMSILSIDYEKVFLKPDHQVIGFNGSNFQNGLSIFVTRPDGSGYGLPVSEIITLTEERAELRLNFDRIGNWKVKFRNPNGDISNNFLIKVLTHRQFDFDGDGSADIGIFRPSSGEWWYRQSSDDQVFASQFGSANDIPVPGDYTGDGKEDVAVFRPSTMEWFVLRSEDGSYYSLTFGSIGDIPVPGDYDQDGKTDIAVFRQSTGHWYFVYSGDQSVRVLHFGQEGDLPLTGDFDGDGTFDVVIYRPSVNEWWLKRSQMGNVAFTFGQVGDVVMVGDLSGGGSWDPVIFRPSTGEWFVVRIENSTFYSFPFGMSGDIPAIGDFDGDGTFDPAIYRPSSSMWYILGSGSGVQIIPFGAKGDIAIPAVFTRSN